MRLHPLRAPETSIDTRACRCPVNCIHYVPWEELVSLEQRRQDQVIDLKKRLSGNLENPLQISGDTRARCNDCPGRGCADCPMYGVGKNPAFKEREERMKAKRRERERAQFAEEENRRTEL